MHDLRKMYSEIGKWLFSISYSAYWTKEILIIIFSSYNKIFIYHFRSVSWGCKIHQLHPFREELSPTSPNKEIYGRKGLLPPVKFFSSVNFSLPCSSSYSLYKYIYDSSLCLSFHCSSTPHPHPKWLLFEFISSQRQMTQMETKIQTFTSV